MSVRVVMSCGRGALMPSVLGLLDRPGVEDQRAVTGGGNQQ
ncbi:hypothetical protein [Halothiobacillus sp.]|nr:hypothetical protein [Halothiobacillus sp.]